MAKKECNKCGYSFSTIGGNYYRHTNSCNGTYVPKGSLRKCKHCKEEFDISDKPNGWMANHTRWCDKNPKRNTYNKNLSYVRSFITNETRNKINESIKKAHADGKYKGAAKKAYETKKRNGTLLHTEETKRKMSKKARESKHRRLQRNIVYYNGYRFDSLWEVALAKRLDFLNIKWIQPEPLVYVDKNKLNRHYFPDFYLPEYDLYLDPKNPAAINNQKEKLNCLAEQYDNIIIIKTLEECETFNII